MSEAAATPTPWRMEEVRTVSGRCFKIGHDTMLFNARVRPGPVCIYDDHGGGENVSKANAEFVLRAVNSHAALVEALETIEAMHLPDQPAADNCDEYTYALKHIGRLRNIAKIALATMKG